MTSTILVRLAELAGLEPRDLALLHRARADFTLSSPVLSTLRLDSSSVLVEARKMGKPLREMPRCQLLSPFKRAGSLRLSGWSLP